MHHRVLVDTKTLAAIGVLSQLSLNTFSIMVLQVDFLAIVCTEELLEHSCFLSAEEEVSSCTSLFYKSVGHTSL